MKRSHVYAFIDITEKCVGFFQVPQDHPYYIKKRDSLLVKKAKLRCIKRDFILDSSPRLDPNEYYLITEVIC